MATITEDYVSYGTAKLLKYKGFNEPCLSYFWSEKIGEVDYTDIPFTNKQLFKGQLLRPTHQMAMKWLREVHHLYINVGFGNDYKGEFLYMGDIYDLTKDAIHAKYEPIIVADDYLLNNPKTYEEAVEAAIKYCLEYLI